MTALLSKRMILALRVTICVLVILACQLPCLLTQPVGVPATPGVNGEPTNQITGGAPAGPTSESIPGATGEPSTAATPVDVIFGSGPFRLLDPTVGLSELSSYKATLTLSFDGTQDNQPSQSSHTFVMRASQENAAHQVTIEATGGDPAPVLMLEMNGVSYEFNGENNCTASITEPDSSLTATWEPAGFLSPIIGAEAAEGETINGLGTDQYTFDERALGESGFSQSTGQVWVASETGVVIRYLLTTKAGADYFGEGVDGTLTSEYNLTDINQLVLIELPSGCPGGLVEAPLLPDAQSVRRLPGVTIYSTAGSIQDGLAFYLEQLPALGWSATGDPAITDSMGVANFVQGEQQLSVIVTSSENMLVVHLLMATIPSPEATP